MKSMTGYWSLELGGTIDENEVMEAPGSLIVQFRHDRRGSLQVEGRVASGGSKAGRFRHDNNLYW